MNDELKKIEIPQVISVGEFAELLGKGPAAVVGELMKNGVMATVNEQIDFDTAQIIGNELGFDIIPKAKEDEVRPNVVNDSEQILRPPVLSWDMWTMVRHLFWMLFVAPRWRLARLVV